MHVLILRKDTRKVTEFLITNISIWKDVSWKRKEYTTSPDYNVCEGKVGERYVRRSISYSKAGCRTQYSAITCHVITNALQLTP